MTAEEDYIRELAEFTAKNNPTNQMCWADWVLRLLDLLAIERKKKTDLELWRELTLPALKELQILKAESLKR